MTTTPQELAMMRTMLDARRVRHDDDHAMVDSLRRRGLIYLIGPPRYRECKVTDRGRALVDADSRACGTGKDRGR